MKQPLIHLRPCTKKGRQDCCQQCRIFVPLLIVCCVNQESLFNPPQQQPSFGKSFKTIPPSFLTPQNHMSHATGKKCPLQFTKCIFIFHRIKNYPYWEL